uniref:Uncharacterized protein n=1 Tax=Aegilops tauschii subsp. strangulata TaxID=200361 RepID=A0A453LLJ2_AEGTS
HSLTHAVTQRREQSNGGGALARSSSRPQVLLAHPSPIGPRSSPPQVKLRPTGTAARGKLRATAAVGARGGQDPPHWRSSAPQPLHL